MAKIEDSLLDTIQLSILQDDLPAFLKHTANLSSLSSLKLTSNLQMNSLLYASRCGSIQILDSILNTAHARLLQSRDSFGHNVLMNAILSRKPRVLRLLMPYMPEEDAVLDADGNSYLHIAATTGLLELVTIVREDLSVEVSLNNYDQSPLHFAASAEVVDYLFKLGCDINSPDFQQWTPLHHMVYHKRDDCSAALINLKADVWARNNQYDTPIDLHLKYRQDSGPFEDFVRHKFDQCLYTSSQTENIIQVESEGDDIDEDLPGREEENKTNKQEESPLSLNVKQYLSDVLLNNSLEISALANFGVEIISNDELVLRKEIGKGAQGKVYRGYFRDNEVAVKSFKKPMLNQQAFVKEILNMIKVRHNRFLLLFGVCVDPVYIVTDLAKGGNLMDAIEENALSEMQKLQVSIQIAEGMSYIHNKNPPIIHRDLKPQNVLLDEFRQSVKIGDLGLSRCAKTDKIENTEICIGTVRYMAPELYSEEPQCTRATDVWAFGCLIMHLFSGIQPWGDLDMTTIQRRLVFQQPLPINKGLSPKIEDLVRNCCDLDPKNRPIFKNVRQALLQTMGVSCSFND